MSLKKWELSYNPSDKDKSRWLLKMLIEERELMAFVNSVPGTVGRPFMLENDECNFGFYIYEGKEEELKNLRESLKKKCPDNAVKDAKPDSKKSSPPASKKETGLDSLIEKVAKGMDNLVIDSAGAEVKRNFEPQQNKQPETAPRETSRQEEIKKEAPRVIPQEQEPPVQEKIIYSGSDGNLGFLDLELNAKYTFEEFVIGPNNRFTAAAAQAVADNPGKIYNPFFIYGGVGLGKTHMMHAVGHYVRRKIPSMRVLYVTTEKFMGEVIDSIRRGQLQQMREYYRQVDLLLIDDIQFLVESESTQEEFFHTFNVLHQSGKQIIITSDRPPKQLTTLEDRLRSRFEWGLIADIKSPNLETRVAILKKKGELEKLKLDDNILLYIASKLKSNIRELEGFLKRINAYASLTHQDVNMELVHSLMADLLPVEAQEETLAQKPPPPAQVYQAPPPQAPPTQAPPPQQEPVFKTPEPQAPLFHAPVFEAPVFQATAPPKATIPDETKTELRQEEKPADMPPPMPKQAPLETPKFQPEAPRPAAPPPKPMSYQNKELSDAGSKSVDVAFFYPEGKDEELIKVKDHFREVIKKHKLKFTLEGIFERAYDFTGKINYAFFTELCKTNNVGIAIVLGPPLESAADPEDFANLLSTVMDDERISLQLVPWAELNKDYRYLNLALDITLLKHKI